jgi:16S rRNA (cytidine1402-2'-O)-methyltransferase
MPGKLTVVATPIGNLEDLSPRARAALADADLIACEDTRHTGRMLARLGLDTRMLSLHEHNERQRVPAILEKLQQGLQVALVSDAGTPLLSDPGFVLVRAAAEQGLPVEHVPGASAIVAALVVSALPPYPFTFLGFPPPRKGKRHRFFARFSDLHHTLVFFESPHRIVASLADALEALGDRPASVGRELTKLHEEVLRGSLSEIQAQLASRPSLKGEFTVVLGPTGPDHER